MKNAVDASAVAFWRKGDRDSRCPSGCRLVAAIRRRWADLDALACTRAVDESWQRQGGTRSWVRPLMRPARPTALGGDLDTGQPDLEVAGAVSEDPTRKCAQPRSRLFKPFLHAGRADSEHARRCSCQSPANPPATSFGSRRQPVARRLFRDTNHRSTVACQGNNSRGLRRARTDTRGPRVTSPFQQTATSCRA